MKVAATKHQKAGRVQVRASYRLWESEQVSCAEAVRRGVASLGVVADDGTHYVATLALGPKPGPNCVLLKSWGSHEGVPGAFAAGGVVEFTGRSVPLPQNRKLIEARILDVEALCQ